MAAVQELGDAVKTATDAMAQSRSTPETNSPSRRSFVRSDTGQDTIQGTVYPEEIKTPTGKSSFELREKEKVESEKQARIRTPAMIRLERWQLFSLCFTLFVAGWDGGTPGPLIPRMQIFYNLDYLMVSLIFVFNCIGFLIGALFNILLSDKLGLGKILVLGSMGQLVAYAMISPATPFPVVCLAFVIDGWGISLQDGQSNSYVASLTSNGAIKMGLLHAFYGLGAVCSPLAATQFADMPRHWSFHFLISLGIATINTVIILSVFKLKHSDECLQQIGEEPRDQDPGDGAHGKFKQIMKQKNVHLLAFWSLAYVGLEFTIGGWTVTYLQNERHGGSSAGYVSTGFFGGLALGRVALLWINEKFGDHFVIYIYTAASLGLELVVWLVPSLIGDSVAVSLVGFFLGPMYPILMNESGRLLPHWLLTGSIGWIASFGFAGSALFPFLTGAISERFGIISLQPLSVSLMACLFCLWLLIPNGQRRQR